MNLIRVLAVLALLLYVLARPSISSAAEFKEPRDGSLMLEFSGPIVEGDDLYLEAWIKKVRESDGARMLLLFVDSSPGGDVEVAMKMGRILRRERMGFAGSHCYSSCVLLLAGAVQRSIADFKELGASALS